MKLASRLSESEDRLRADLGCVAFASDVGEQLQFVDMADGEANRQSPHVDTAT